MSGSRARELLNMELAEPSKDQINAKMVVSYSGNYERGGWNSGTKIRRRFYKSLAFNHSCFGICFSVLLFIADP
jgi:hypothetical protein